MITLRAHKPACLSVTRAKLTGEGVAPAVSFTQARVPRPAEIEWTIDAPRPARARISLWYSATKDGADFRLFAGGRETAGRLEATAGVFPDDSGMNFEKTPICMVNLDKGPQKIRLSIDSVPDDCELAVSALWLEWEDLAWPAGADYGVMIHWTAQSQPRQGSIVPYARAAEALDVNRLAEDLKNMGAGYLILTANHEYPHFPGPLAAWEREFPGMTVRRDLLRELAEKLHGRGMGCVLYVNPYAAYLRSQRLRAFLPDGPDRAAGTPLPEVCLADYEAFSTALVSAIGEEYGELIDGYWFDSCYQPFYDWGAYDVDGLLKAAKAGNPRRAACVNSWILPVVSDRQDYWAGEVASVCRLPEPGELRRGPMPGTPLHTLLILDDPWVHAEPDSPVAPPRYTARELADYIAASRRIGAPVSVNMGVYQDGTFGEASLAVMRELAGMMKRVLY